MADISNLKPNQEVNIIFPDGYRMDGVFLEYLPKVQRYKFEMHIGGVDRSSGTTVLFSKETILKSEITAIN